MAKKKRTILKPIKSTAVVESETGDLPSIQPEGDDQPATEVFLDTCENLEGEPIEEGSIEMQGPTVLPASPKQVRWPDDVEREDFSAQARDVRSRFKTNQLPSKCGACDLLGPTIANCNKEKGVVWKKKGIVEQRSKALVAEKTHTVKVGSELGGESVGEGGCQAEKTHGKEENEQPVSVDTSSKEVWLTPRKRGSKQVAINDEKATTNNGYVVLSEQRSVLEICRENKVGLGALFETKINHDKVGDMIAMSFPNWEFFSSIASSKRIILIWQAKFVHDEVLLDNEQFIHSKVKKVGLIEEFYFIAVYGRNCPAERKLLFEKLAALGMLNRPWLILGDFNVMFNFQDRNGGKKILTKDIEDAQKWLSLGQVEEVYCSGAFYTLTNKHDMGTRIFSKLDRVLINEDWLDQFPTIKPRFKWIVLCCWNKYSDANTVGELVKKLLRVKHVLKKFNREEEENRLGHEYAAALKQYSCFHRQQSKVSWMQNGEDNTKYFHSLTKKRKMENRITTFESHGKIVDDYSEVVEHLLNHFRNFMGKKSLATRRLNQDCIQQGPTLTLEKQAKLIRSFTEKDVKKAMFGIHSTKSPGLDGFGSGFFKSLWKEIGADVSKAILNFFEEGSMPISLKDAVITLIPKTQDPKDASDYRPIACCNTVYKCISKMICSRLEEVLPCLVSDNRGAFVKNRLLAHNIMIFQDLLKGYTRRNVSARCIMKINLSKACDTVDWHFVEDILNSLCFPSRFIHCFIVYLRGMNCFLLLNGRIQGSFKGEKGLRQGDPLSPMLFVLIMEYLSRLLSQVSNKKGFGFHPLCKNLRLTNLCFPDDLIIFCKGNMKYVELVNDAFQEFCQATGLSANKKKSHIYFGGVKEETKINILALTQMEEGSFPLKYLGIKLRPTKRKASDCGLILDKLRLKLNGWASRNLSFAGRAQLIQYVLLGIRVNSTPPPGEKFAFPGGIGFREGKLWNVALIAKHLWALSNKQDNLWVKWINSIYLKGQDVWSYLVKPDVSWYFKKLLKIRNTTNVSLLNLASSGCKFKVQRFYDEMLGAAKVPYATNVWHKIIVPKHRFIYWQIINEHLLTQDILSRFLPIASGLCVVCDIDPESHNHIFTDCTITKKLINRVEVLNAIIAAVLYMLWKNRNDCLFNDVCNNISSLSKEIKCIVKARVVGVHCKSQKRKDQYVMSVVNSCDPGSKSSKKGKYASPPRRRSCRVPGPEEYKSRQLGHQAFDLLTYHAMPLDEETPNHNYGVLELGADSTDVRAMLPLQDYFINFLVIVGLMRSINSFPKACLLSGLFIFYLSLLRWAQLEVREKFCIFMN
uniref:Reverse transcriptase domain-containing protein n=1 Tax=Cannabis sativa TaxID=3483 RepID=A0A803QC82_CANSA